MNLDSNNKVTIPPMKNFNLFFFFCSLNVFNLISQNTTKNFETNFNKAEKTFDIVYQNGKAQTLSYSRGDYAEALPVFLDLYLQDSTNMNLAFKLGVCYLNSRTERVQSIYYFKKAVTAVTDDYRETSHKERNTPIISYEFLGDAYHWNYQFDKAMEMYEKFIALISKSVNKNDSVIIETNRKIQMCKTGKLLVANPVKIKIENMGDAINSPYPDYSPVLSADQNTIFFTSRRPGSTGGLKDDEGNFMEDIYTSNKTDSGWSNVKNIGSPINTDGHEATVGLSPDGQTILIYKDDAGDGNIYTTTLNGDVWSTPVKLNDNINSIYWEPCAAISADGTVLYFSSNRPGGFGGRDLYTSKRTPKGEWAKAQNMGAVINTPYDEDAPFIHPDGITLSFSSNGHKTMGGFDIFTSTLVKNATWSAPQNVGHPINTTDDDIYYVISPNGLKAYFSSFRKNGIGEKDNYVATFLERKETPLTLLKGEVITESGKGVKDVEIIVTDNETEQVVGIYTTNSKSGQYIFILTPGKNYNITYQAEGYLFYSENMEIPMETNYYEIRRAIILDPIIVGSRIILKNIFFDFDKATLRPISNVEIKNLVTIMNKYPNMKVEISGHTDNKGNDAYNLKLSDERAKAVVAKLITSGINSNRMKAKGYGETMPIAKNEKPDGSDNPEGRQLNRRVEFKITEID
jgi:outer membrane protein OmpA-like peptidoglycan-associated protein/tetratricopeptide (TPR) repeat protein